MYIIALSSLIPSVIVGSVDRIQPRDNLVVSGFDVKRARTLDYDRLLGGFFQGATFFLHRGFSTISRFLERVLMKHIE